MLTSWMFIWTGDFPGPGDLTHARHGLNSKAVVALPLRGPQAHVPTGQHGTTGPRGLLPVFWPEDEKDQQFDSVLGLSPRYHGRE